jgi:uncharacterized membrane protein YgdD (TMEM256/DUF423 family)
MSARGFAATGALLAFAGVAAGAFGAHALRSRLGPDLLAVFETGVRYHLLHALALFAVAWVNTQWPGRAARASGWLFIAGIVLFSGSLYLLVLTGQRGLGAITPIGGLCQLAGWLALAWAVWRGKPRG